MYLAWLLRYYIVLDLAKHIPTENAFIPVFVLGVIPFSTLGIIGSRNTSFELLTITIGPPASLLRRSDLSVWLGIKNVSSITPVRNNQEG